MPIPVTISRVEKLTNLRRRTTVRPHTKLFISYADFLHSRSRKRAKRESISLSAISSLINYLLVTC